MFANQVDDLQLISLEKLAEGVSQSCCILLLLNDETLTSKWCEHEVQCARSLGIPIICLLDIDRQPARPLIDSLMEKNYGWLFDRQVVSYSTQGRDHSYVLIADAVKQAIQDSSVTKQEPLPQEQQVQEKGPSMRIHDIPSDDDSSASNKVDSTVESQFKAAVILMFKSPEAAFNKLTGDMSSAGISSKVFLKALKLLGLTKMPKESRRALRKTISGPSKLITREAWLAFMGGGNDGKANGRNATGHSKELALAMLPAEVPECKSLCASTRST